MMQRQMLLLNRKWRAHAGIIGVGGWRPESHKSKKVKILGGLMML